MDDPSRPPSRLLHNEQLRQEVMDVLKANWPKRQPRVWNKLQGTMLKTAAFLSMRQIIDFQKETERAPGGPFRPEALEITNVVLEAVVRKVARPAFFIQNNLPQLPQSGYWHDRLQGNQPSLTQIPAVGRVELKNHETLAWNGTAWLVRENVVITNAHVARDFAVRGNGGWIARINAMNRSVKSRVDFREEYQQDAEEEIEVTQILFMEEGNGPDIALLKLAAGPNPRPVIPLATAEEIKAKREVVTVGYPKNDSSVGDPELLQTIFNNIFDVKCFSPGTVTNFLGHYLTHDCSTLGGNSGSVVLDLESGKAVGLHYGGSYLVDNFAVPAPVVSALLTRLGL